MGDEARQVGEFGQRYVVGFLLDQTRQEVALVRKNRPEWQAGRLNGIGGKVEPGESSSEAMAREFEEEAGCVIHADRWERLCTVSWPNDLARVGSGKAATVDFFRYVWPHPCALRDLVSTRTDESVETHSIRSALAFERVIPNLTWLLPLAAYAADRYEPFTVQATVAEAIHPIAPLTDSSGAGE